MIYIHFPFCKSFCTYCGFYSVRERDKIGKYTESLLREIYLRKAFLCQCSRPSTLYIGGGTPSLWPVEQLEEVVRAISAVLQGETVSDYVNFNGHSGSTISGDDAGIFPFAEFTVEVNPDDITEEYALALRRLGVNRVSMGVQSFCDRSLCWMARRHDAAEAVEAFRVLRSTGFGNISLDLIFGYDPVLQDAADSADGNMLAGHPCVSEFSDRGMAREFHGTSDEELMRLWDNDLETIMRLRPEHISAYQMGLDEGSVLGEMASSGRYREPSDELCAAQYALLQRRLASAGYVQYEVSNFSLPSRRAVHNSGYWDRSPYIGLGPGAHSFDGDRRRSWNAPDVDRYIAAFGDSAALPPVASGSSGDSGASGSFGFLGLPSVASGEVLTEEDILTETVMLGLRTVDGLPLTALAALCQLSTPSVSARRSVAVGSSLSPIVAVHSSGAAELSRSSVFPLLPRPLQVSIDRLLSSGSLIFRDGCLRIPPDRLFISDSIIRELLP